MVRRFAVSIALVWMCLHALSVATGTIVLLATGNAGAEIVCTCVHGDGDDVRCPMHHKPAGSGPCHLQHAQGDLDAALLSTLVPLTLPAASAAIVVDPAPSDVIEDAQPPFVTRVAPPDCPPPRV